ncbi:rab11 family-interacting protein 2 isoform X2 [Daktulosphaira vitifoliae]|uniref:rab11 family-interacting protein 2 isoform X2 n=1 Tax=Daktulosphaira vitifoliae TaxID=58002 RepID=UPI0021AA88E6|nr:rab11 family-interacting protein 2 isoform X2 [Daktulosphaira vitifoliae]
MWNPTHVQVTVQKARLQGITTDKDSSASLFVTIALEDGSSGRSHHSEKYQTSSKRPEEHHSDGDITIVEWHELCELEIPEWRRGGGGAPELELCVLTRKKRGKNTTSFIGGLVPSSDHKIGRTTIPLDDADVYERPKSKWFQLHSKHGRDIVGELQAKIAYTVKSSSGSGTLSKKEKHKLSIGHLSSSSSISGSLLSLGSSGSGKGRSFKKLAKSLTGKIKRQKNNSTIDGLTEEDNIETPHRSEFESSDVDDVGADDFTLDGEDFSPISYPKVVESSVKDLSWSLDAVEGDQIKKLALSPSAERNNSNISTISQKTPERDEWQRKLYGGTVGGRDSLKLPLSTSDVTNTTLTTSDRKNSPSHSTASTPPRSPSFTEKHSPKTGVNKWSGVAKRVVVGMEQHKSPSLDRSMDGGGEFDGKTKDELIMMIMELRRRLADESKRREDLEDYVDSLLARVMDRAPAVLQKPYEATACR